jgi:hypothetical protein
VVRRISDERRVDWCEEIMLGAPLFIVPRGVVGCWEGASMERRLRRSKGQVKDGIL